jgi:hypothetical protein
LRKIRRCKDCGEVFANIFEEADHLVENEEDVFDPVYEIQEGYSLKLGSLLRNLYNNAHNPIETRRLAEETFEILYMATIDPKKFTKYAREAFISAVMRGVDYEYKKLLEQEKDEDV